MFTQPRLRMASSLAEQLGCEFEDAPAGPIIRTDGQKATSVPGVSASYWYGGKENATTSPVRVGWAMSVVEPGPFGTE